MTFATPRIGPGEESSDWAVAAGRADTTVLYMAAGTRVETVRALHAEGRSMSTPVVVVENASLPDMRRIVTTLGGLADLPLDEAGGPVLVLIGNVYGDLLAAADAGAGDGIVRAGAR